MSDKSNAVEWLAIEFHARDANHLVRVPWNDESEGLKDDYRDTAREALAEAPVVAVDALLSDEAVGAARRSMAHFTKGQDERWAGLPSWMTWDTTARTAIQAAVEAVTGISDTNNAPSVADQLTGKRDSS